MSIAFLGHINDILTALGINYEFGEWTSEPVPYPYFVGEFAEETTLTKQEDGHQEATFILNGFGHSWLDMMEAKELIENNIDHTAILSNQNGIAVSYDSALVIQSEDAEIMRIQINLNVKEWSVI